MAITEAEYWSRDNYRIRFVENGQEKFTKQGHPDYDRVLAARTPTAFVPSVRVRPSLSRFEFKKRVLDSGRYGDIRSSYASLSNEAKLYWEDADTIYRDSVLVNELKTLLGLTDQQVDNFFASS